MLRLCHMLCTPFRRITETQLHRGLRAGRGPGCDIAIHSGLGMRQTATAGTRSIRGTGGVAGCSGACNERVLGQDSHVSARVTIEKEVLALETGSG